MSGKWSMKRQLVAVLLVVVGGSSFADTKDVRKVVAQIGAEWTDEAKLRKLHESLTEKFKDAPTFDEMASKIKWVVAVDVFDAKRARTIAARAEGGLEVKKGDIVEVDFRVDPNRAKSFDEMPRVIKVVCKAGSAEFEACKRSTQLGAFDGEGKRTGWTN